MASYADVLEQIEDSNSSGDDSAYEGEGYLPKATSFTVWDWGHALYR